MSSARIIGPGRAGGSLALALERAGWQVDVAARGADPAPLAAGVDLLMIATPDPVIAQVAAAVEPVPSTVVAHLAGSLGLDVLAPHPRRGSLHPIVAMPDPELGARRLPGAWFAVSGDDVVRRAVADLGGRTVEVDDAGRVAHHAAAVIASNHLVALLGQAERTAALAKVPLEAYLGLVRSTVENVAELGPAAALTGPVARGDWDTVARHVEAIPDDDRLAYVALADAARRLTA